MRDSRAIIAALRHALVAAAVLMLPAITWAATRGPDAGGYTATDATVYSFVDISGSSGGASILSGTDDGSAGLSLPFTFTFYGQPYTKVCVSTNGGLYFVADLAQCGGINDFANSDLSGSTPEGDRPAVFPFWSDLTFQVSGAGSVYYQVLGVPGSRRLVVQWSNAFPQGSSNPVTFQAILSEASNRILFQYQVAALGDADSASEGGAATIGIRNAGGLVTGQQLPWSYNAKVVSNESAILFTPPGLTTPVITWANPASIPYGRALGAAQLNAIADVPGTFTYTPPAGTVLNAGSGQLLSVLFTPTDTAHYTTATATASIDVTPAPTTTTLYGLPPSVGTLQPIALIAVVSNAGGLTPQGTVTFNDGATPLGSSAVSNGIAFLIATGITPGVHPFAAQFSGNGNFATSTSAAANVTVQPATASTITLLFPVTNPTAAGHPSPLLAIVRPLAGTGTVTGSVQFAEGSTVLGTATLTNGLASISPTLSAGQHQITARYLGNTAFAASSSAPIVQTVSTGTAPATSSTALAVTPAASNAGDPVTLTATVTPAAGTPSGSVTFFVDTVPIGTAPVTNVGGVFKAALTTSTLSRGAHLVTASYGGSTAVASSNSLPVVALVQ
ncbi:MAG TPA: Ig-like domain-containing protein [Vicinamibacterales bacterium]|nr:Ig-like domain-containing protein [Vicinamibacterales bacterium]